MSEAIGYSYVRFSSKGKQARGSSLYRQTQTTCAGESPESWCARNGVLFDASTTFKDLGESAWTGRNARQGELRVFLDAIKARLIRPGSFFLVESVDRITRQGVDEGLAIIKQILNAGVSIVTLANGRVYGPDSCKGLMKGLLELQMYLEQAKDYSDRLSARVSAARQRKRTKARETGALMTTMMPPWLKATGEGDNRRAEVVPEKVAVMQRIIDLVIAGKGATRIVRLMLEEGVPPLSRRDNWARTTIRRLVSDRALLGEHQPMRRVFNPEKAKYERSKEGPPIEGYYPAIVSLDRFHQAKACLGSRKLKNTGRDSRLVNVFSGLLKDARNGLSYITSLRVERGNKRHHVLLSAVKTGGSNSFPFRVFEEAILSKLKEINPKDLLPATGEGDLLLGLQTEKESVETDILSLKADIDRKYSSNLVEILRSKEARLEELVGLIATATLSIACPAANSWAEARNLMDLIADAPDPDEMRLRLRAVFKRAIECIQLLVVARGRDRLCAAQAWFVGAVEHRDWLIYHRPPKGNKSCRVKGDTFVESRRFELGDGPLDLRNREHARRLEQSLLAVELD